MNATRAACAWLACALALGWADTARAAAMGSADQTPVPAPALTPTDAAARQINWTAVVVSFENDKFFAGSDRHYTQGARVTFLYEAGAENPLTKLAQETLQVAERFVPVLQASHIQRGKLAVSLGQDMFTPEDTTIAALQPLDRPYAAWLYAAAGFHAIEGDTSYVAEASLGIVGPSALGELFQNRWHDVINVAHSQGWDNQLRDEPGLNLAFEVRRKFHRSPWHDIIPRAALVVGNVNTHVSVGASVRFGPNLPGDFGHDLIRAGSGAVERTSGFAPYAFISADVRLVGRNIFLDGNTWKDSHSVAKRPVVADVNAGFALNWPRFRLIYTQNYRTKDFYGQPKRDVFGSVSFAVLF